MERKTGTAWETGGIRILARRLVARVRLGLGSPWFVITVCTFTFTRQPDSQAEEYKWKDGALLWSTDALSWYNPQQVLAAWPSTDVSANAIFGTGTHTITLGSEVLVNAIDLEAGAGNV